MPRGIAVCLLLFVYLFLSCNESPEDGYFYCADARYNATILAVGYRSDDSLLSVSFTSALSFCTDNDDEYRYEVKRLDISLVTFKDTLLMEKSNEETLYPLPESSERIFSGSIACYSECAIAIPLDTLPRVSLHYIMDDFNYVLLLDTNGVLAAEYPLSPRE